MSRQDQSASASSRAPGPAEVPGNDWTLLGEVPTGSPPPSAAVLPGDSERSPDGEVVVCLPPGADPDPELCEALARRHRLAADLVTVGPVGPADDPEDPFGVVLDLTRELTDPQDGLVLLAALGPLAVRRETYDAVGGTRGAGAGTPVMDAVVERLDFAHRLLCYGAVFVPEPRARVQSPVAGTVSELTRAATVAATEGRDMAPGWPAVASLLPEWPFRAPGSPRRLRRPALAINVEAGGASGGEVSLSVARILAGRSGDFELRVTGADSHPERAEIEAAVAEDPRAELGGPSTLEFCESPVQMLIPGIALPDERTVADLHRMLAAERVGALHVTVPGAPPHETMIEVLASGALSRAKRLAKRGDEPLEAVLGRVFGERWVSGVEVSVRRHGVSEPQVTEHGPLASASDLEHERTQHLRFRDRAEDLEQRSATMARRLLSDRLRTRAQRRRADELEERLRAAGG